MKDKIVFTCRAVVFLQNINLNTFECNFKILSDSNVNYVYIASQSIPAYRHGDTVDGWTPYKDWTLVVCFRIYALPETKLEIERAMRSDIFAFYFNRFATDLIFQNSALVDAIKLHLRGDGWYILGEKID